jgi:hypothetical protein
MEYCSPLGEDQYKEKQTCFSLQGLKDISYAWNKENPKDRIKNINKLSINQLWSEINKKMSSQCNGSGKEFCWIKKLNPNNRTSEVLRSIKPEKPREWYKNKNAWLSNYDIQNVMRQYQDKKNLKYKFIGVFSIDFEYSEFGKCLYAEICNLDILSLYKQGYKYLGMITNLDKHDEPGSHWTSLFICIDPTKPCFGAHYYDSVASEPPKEISKFVAKLKLQAQSLIDLNNNKKTFEFAFNYNAIRHQYGNNECGMFSMVYQIRWLNLLKKNKNTTLRDVTSKKLTDAQMNKCFRNKLFVPNTKEEIDKKAAK